MPLPCEIIPITRVAERPGSGHINFTKAGLTGERKWVCPWIFTDGRTYLDFVQQLLGMTVPGPNYIPVISYPDTFSPDLPFLYCQEVSIEGEDIYGTDGWGRAAYRRAICTAKYSPYEMGEHFHLAAQMFTCKEGTLSFIGYPSPMPARPARLADDQFTVMAAQLTNTIAKLDKILAGLVGAALPDPGNVDLLGDLNNAFGFNPDRNQLQQIRNRLQGQLDRINQRTQDADVKKLSDYLADLLNWQNNQRMIFQNPGVNADIYAGANAGGNPVTVPVGKIIPLGEYTLERHFVLAPNFIQWVAMMGCTNAYYFLGFPPWTLLFSGVDGKRALLPNGSRCWDITLKFLFNPNGHNMIYRPEKGRFEVVVSTTPSNAGWLTAGLTGWKVIDQPVHRYLYEPIDYAPFLNYI